MSVPDEPATDQTDQPLADPAFRVWRRVHRSASLALALVASAHAALTAVFYEQWSANAVWFLGTGLGLLLLAVMNLAHVGLEPCRMPTAPALRAANWVFAVFGIGAFVAVPQPQAAVIVVALIAQAVSAHRTLPGVSM
jgi:hypothetical protein